MYLLKYWNKRFSCYNENNIGIPQNEFGDQSRLLANFYLNDYDYVMHQECINNDAMYTRFADDQVILFNDEDSINKIMLICNEKLRKLGLNLNAGKVKKFTSDNLKRYYLFDIIDGLDKKEFDKSCNVFFELYENDYFVRSDTFFRRCLTLGLNNFSLSNRAKIVSEVTKEAFILGCNYNHLTSIYKNLNNEEKEMFIIELKRLFKQVKLNGFRYIVITFLKKNNLKELYDELINEV